MIRIKNSGVTIGLLLVAAFVLSLLSPLQAQSKSEAKKVNINTANLDELQTLPRIGEKVAQRIIDYRKEHGPFKKIEELMKVQGVGEKTFKQLKDKIEVGSKTK
ncbi:MAG: helix-hairpin-helix domain-containing protein [Candidatus Aminicenantes bacterium]|jgi:competence protein ComEA